MHSDEHGWGGVVLQSRVAVPPSGIGIATEVLNAIRLPSKFQRTQIWMEMRRQINASVSIRVNQWSETNFPLYSKANLLRFAFSFKIFVLLAWSLC